MGIREDFSRSIDCLRTLFPNDAEEWVEWLRKLPALEDLVVRFFELYEQQNSEIDWICSGVRRPLTLEEREWFWIELGEPKRFFGRSENEFPDVDADLLFAAWIEFQALLMFVRHSVYVKQSVGHMPTSEELRGPIWDSCCERQRHRFAPILEKIML